MANRISKSGKKFASSHSSYTKMAGVLVRELESAEELSKISAGIIKTNLPNLRGKKRIKVINEGSCLLLRLRGNISMQEVRLYGDNRALISRIEDYAKQEGIQLDVSQ